MQLQLYCRVWVVNGWRPIGHCADRGPAVGARRRQHGDGDGRQGDRLRDEVGRRRLIADFPVAGRRELNGGAPHRQHGRARNIVAIVARHADFMGAEVVVRSLYAQRPRLRRARLGEHRGGVMARPQACQGSQDEQRGGAQNKRTTPIVFGKIK